MFYSVKQKNFETLKFKNTQVVEQVFEEYLLYALK